MNSLEALILFACALSLLLAVALLLLWRRLRRQQRLIAGLESALTAMQDDQRALTLAGSGLDERLLNSDVRWRDLQNRVQKLEGQLSSERSYREAIELVRKGGGPGRLIEELQLTEGEAQLITMLHGQASGSG